MKRCFNKAQIILLLSASMFFAVSCSGSNSGMDYESLLSSVIEENRELHDQLSDVEESLAEANSKGGEKDGEISSLLQENSNNDSEIDSLNSENQELKSDSESKDVIIGSQSDEIDSLASENEELKNEKTELEDELDSAKSENSELKSENDELKSENDELKSDNESLSEQATSEERQYNKAGGFFERNTTELLTFLRWGASSSGNPSNTIVCNGTEGMSFQFECVSGRFMYQYRDDNNKLIQETATSLTRLPGESMWWQVANNGSGYSMEKSFIKCIIYDGDSIYGYCVLEIDDQKEIPNPSVSFAQELNVIKEMLVEGDVSNEQVTQAINDAIYSQPLGRLYSYKAEEMTLDETSGLYEVGVDLVRASEDDESRFISIIDSKGNMIINQMFDFGFDDPYTIFYTWDGTMNKGYNPAIPLWNVFYPGESYQWKSSTYTQDTFEAATTYITIMVESFDNVFGYAVAKICQNTYDSLEVSVLKSALTPAIYGKRQDVTRDTLKTITDSIIDADKAIE